MKLTNISSRVYLHELLDQADIDDLERIKLICEYRINRLTGGE